MITVSKRTFLFSPEDRINAPRMVAISLAKREVHGHAYAFSLKGLTNLILLQANKGIKHSWIFDHSQYVSAYNPAMKVEVDRLIGVKNVTVYLATEPNGSISHDKFAVVDRMTTIYSSANFTGDAERQSNHAIIERGRVVAKGFMAHWQYIQSTAVLLNAPLPHRDTMVVET